MKDFARDATHTGPIEQAKLLPRLICDGTPIGGDDSRVAPGRRETEISGTGLEQSVVLGRAGDVRPCAFSNVF